MAALLIQFCWHPAAALLAAAQQPGSLGGGVEGKVGANDDACTRGSPDHALQGRRLEQRSSSVSGSAAAGWGCGLEQAAAWQAAASCLLLPGPLLLQPAGLKTNLTLYRPFTSVSRRSSPAAPPLLRGSATGLAATVPPLAPLLLALPACIRTFMVSSGWMVLCEAARAMAPATTS